MQRQKVADTFLFLEGQDLKLLPCYSCDWMQICQARPACKAHRPSTLRPANHSPKNIPHTVQTKRVATTCTKMSKICFSDIDGTIMHDPSIKDKDAEVLVTPPSASGRQGVISAVTLQKVAELRTKGVKFVVITGARLSTLMMRLPYLPQADAFVCENGGRIFYPGSPLPTACPVTEDLAWRQLQEHAAGPASQDGVPPEKRTGSLWDLYRTLKAQGWRLDANGYTTSFRVHASKPTGTTSTHVPTQLQQQMQQSQPQQQRQGRRFGPLAPIRFIGRMLYQLGGGGVGTGTSSGGSAGGSTGSGSSSSSSHSPEALQQVTSQTHMGLTNSYNLGGADFYPNTSGKVEAARYLMQRFSAARQDCVFLCDDDNDLALAADVGKAFLPSITSESVARAVERSPSQFVKSSLQGTAATEDMLDAVCKHYQL